MISDSINSLSAICSYGEFQRAMSDNRERYILQSINTKVGALGTLPDFYSSEAFVELPITGAPIYKRAFWWMRSLF